MSNKVYKQSCLNFIDFFGLNFQFSIDGYEQYRTKTGAIITIMYVVITIGLFFGFGVDLYQRKNPRVSNNVINDVYKEMNFSNQNFTFAFRIEDRTGKILLNDSIAYLELTYFYYIIDENGQWKSIFSDFHPFQRCKNIPGIEQNEKEFNISLVSWFCIDFHDLRMGGNWDGNFVYGMLINTKQCQYSKNKNCLSDTDLRNNFQNDLTGSNYYYSFLYMEALPEMDNFENPIKLNLINKYETLSLKVGKRLVHTFKKVNIDNDRGWFFNDMQSLSFYSSDTLVSDFSFKDELNEDVIYTHLIYFGKKVDLYSRSYTKIQEVIANIGGFAKLFYTILAFVYLIIGKFLKVNFLIERIDFNDLDEKRERKDLKVSSNYFESKQQINNKKNSSNRENLVKHLSVSKIYMPKEEDMNRNSKYLSSNNLFNTDDLNIIETKKKVLSKNIYFSERPQFLPLRNKKYEEKTNVIYFNENKENHNKKINGHIFYSPNLKEKKMLNVLKIEDARKKSIYKDLKFKNNLKYKENKISLLKIFFNNICNWDRNPFSQPRNKFEMLDFYIQKNLNIFNYLKICQNLNEMYNIFLLEKSEEKEFEKLKEVHIGNV